MGNNYLTREQMKEVFKDNPEILNGLMNIWFPEKKCEYCSSIFISKRSNHKFCSESCNRAKQNEVRKEKRRIKRLEKKIEKAICLNCGKIYDKTTHNRKYCSIKCRKSRVWKIKRTREGILSKEQILAFNEAAKKQFILNLKTTTCNFCGVEFKQHKKQETKYCCDFCRKAAYKYVTGPHVKKGEVNGIN